MKAPDEFCKFCGYFFQDIFDIYATPEDAIMFARSQITTAERDAVRKFLDQILSSSLTGRQLQELWFHSGSEVWFPDADKNRKFLELIRRLI